MRHWRTSEFGWDGRLRPSLSGLCCQLGLEEFLYPIQNFLTAFRLVDCLPQGRASGYAMGEPGGELLHLTFGTRHFFFEQHLKISADHLVAIGLGGFVI